MHFVGGKVKARILYSIVASVDPDTEDTIWLGGGHNRDTRRKQNFAAFNKPPKLLEILTSPLSFSMNRRSWTERCYSNLIYFNETDNGGHFAALEQPTIFTNEVRAAFRSLR